MLKYDLIIPLKKMGPFLIKLIRTLDFRNDRFQDVKPEMKSKVFWSKGRKKYRLSQQPRMSGYNNT